MTYPKCNIGAPSICGKPAIADVGVTTVSVDKYWGAAVCIDHLHLFARNDDTRIEYVDHFVDNQ